MRSYSPYIFISSSQQFNNDNVWLLDIVIFLNNDKDVIEIMSRNLFYIFICWNFFENVNDSGCENTKCLS